MLGTAQLWLANPYVAGAVAGLVSAAAVDIAAFRSWKSWNDAVSYSWGLASFRWFQGALLGVVTAVGLQTVS